MIFTCETKLCLLVEFIQNTSVYREFDQNVSVFVTKNVFLLNTKFKNMKNITKFDQFCRKHTVEKIPELLKLCPLTVLCWVTGIYSCSESSETLPR